MWNNTKKLRSILILIFFLSLQAWGYASEVSVGKKTVQIVDSFARFVHHFGQPVLQVYFFSRPLTDFQKEMIAFKYYPTEDDFENICGGNYPVLELMFLFAAGTQTCSNDALMSYTAVFEKTKTFPFDVTEEYAPINWNFNRSKDTPLSEIGIMKFSCSFIHGGTVDMQIKNHWLAKRANYSHFLQGCDSLLFSWNVDMATKVIVPSEVKAPPLTITRDMIKDSVISWVSKYNLLSINLFKRELTSDEKNAAAGYPPHMQYDDFIGYVSVSYKSAPDLFSSTKPEKTTIAIIRQEGPKKFRIFEYLLEVGNYQMSGSPKPGSKISFQSQGTGIADPVVGKPAAAWDIDISGVLQRVN